MLIALTGGIGSGKSTVAEIWKGLGATIIDADELAREVVAPDSTVLRMLVDEFGSELLNSDGTLNRAYLASVIFSDSEKRSTVEGIMHPAIQRLALQRVAEANGVVVYVIPLLVESNSPMDFDAIVNIATPESVRKERLVTLRNLSPEEAESRILSQATESERRDVADFQLDGNCSLSELRENAEELYRRITRGPRR